MKDLLFENTMSRNDSHMIDIATGGKHRGLVVNRTMSLARFRGKLSDPMIDKAVSFAAYAKMDADQKAARKMMAGFVMCAHFRDGLRKGHCQQHRSVLAYDLDNVTPEQLDDLRSGLTPISRYHWFMHTTRSHCPERPRVRLFVFLSRNVNADEFHALVRLVAELLTDKDGIEIPDPVSFKWNQVMYWPSISEGQEFWTDENPAAILDVDAFLARHPNWTDLSTLPKPKGAAGARRADPGARAEDPTRKRGWIGAFCRAYTVEGAIAEFLPDIYEPGDSITETRYSYAPGTGRNGAVVYDDGKFLHSHHGSDPAEGLHNAFDLVRIHKFGRLDDKTHGNTSPTSLPSYRAMMEMVQQDERSLIAFSETAPGVDFDDYDEQGDCQDGLQDDPLADPEIADLIGSVPSEKKPAPDRKWLARMRRKANGGLAAVLHNITLICENDPKIAPAIGYNELTLDPVAFRPIRAKGFDLPSDPVPRGRRYRRWNNGDDISIQRLCSAPVEFGGYAFDPPRVAVEAAVIIAGKRKSFHPVRDLILEFHARWVSAGRPTGLIDTWAHRYLRCVDNAFHREVSRTLLIAICARTFRPGCKFDVVTIIRGEQGGRKSTFWKKMAIREEYFGELGKDFERPDRMIEGMRGRLIVELPEMSGFRNDTSELAKAFISTATDRHRLAYARREDDYPRQCILVGTSNLDTILHDPTGNRRFWILEDTHSEKRNDFIDIDAFEAELPMLYGEAYQAYLDLCAERQGGDLYLDLRSEEARQYRDKLTEQYRERTVTEIVADVMRDDLDTPISAAEAASPGADRFESEGPEQMFLRNMTTGTEMYERLRSSMLLDPYRNVDCRVVGKALGLLEGWTPLGTVHRHGQKARWYVRTGQPEVRFIPAPEMEEDLI